MPYDEKNSRCNPDLRLEPSMIAPSPTVAQISSPNRRAQTESLTFSKGLQTSSTAANARLPLFGDELLPVAFFLDAISLAKLLQSCKRGREELGRLTTLRWVASVRE